MDRKKMMHKLKSFLPLLPFTSSVVPTFSFVSCERLLWWREFFTDGAISIHPIPDFNFHISFFIYCLRPVASARNEHPIFATLPNKRFGGTTQTANSHLFHDLTCARMPAQNPAANLAAENFFLVVHMEKNFTL
jgi:hypothetical protein